MELLPEETASTCTIEKTRKMERKKEMMRMLAIVCL